MNSFTFDAVRFAMGAILRRDARASEHNAASRIVAISDGSDPEPA
jgi:hypothetical protein